MNNEEKILAVLEKHSSTLDTLTSTVSTLVTAVGTLAAKVDKLETKVDKLDAELADTKHHVILIENEHGKRLGGLEDGQAVLMDYAKETRTDIVEIKARQENQQFQITWPDGRAVKKTS